LVRHYLKDFALGSAHVLLDPFCGTGTTLVEAKRCGVPSVGLEANLFAQFACAVKTDWAVDPEELETSARLAAARALARLVDQGIDDDTPYSGDTSTLGLRRLPPEAGALLLTNSISPLPLHKTLVVLDELEALRSEPHYGHARLALANALVFSISNLLFGFIKNKAELRALKKTLVRSNTRNVYKEDDDDTWVAQHPEIQRIASAIEQRRVELGKDSGFERLYGRVTKLYFGGMARHLADLRTVLRPGAQLAYVVGDQASYLQVMIRTGQLLADIARALGYQVVRIDLFRTRFATATKEQLREEVVVLRWPG
jgi:hypothetical protein